MRCLLLILSLKTVFADEIKNVTPESDTRKFTTVSPEFETWNVTSSVSSMLTVTEGFRYSDDFETNLTCAALCSKCSGQDIFVENSKKPGEKIQLYISSYYEGPGGGWDGSGCVPAIEMAFDDINARSDILPQYELRAIWNDTKCEAGSGSRALFDQLFREPTKIMILGGGCSPPAEAIASTAHYWNLITVAYGAESPALSNRKFYPYLYRSVSPATVYNYLRIRLLREYGWHRVATIHENREHFKLSMDHMHDLLKEANITLVTSESFFTNPRNQIENIKRKDAKIIIGNMFEDTARKVFCEAYKEGITGKGYVWMMLGWYEHKFWEKSKHAEDIIDCTAKEMEQAVDGYIGTTGTLLNDPAISKVANITSTEYISRLKLRLTQPENLKYDFNPYGATGYDGAWIIALMLHEAALVLEERNATKRLEDFTYNDPEMRDLFFKILADVQFEGVSGPISFINGDRIGVIQLEQLQTGCLEGWVRYANDCYVFMESPLTWIDAEDNEVPLDHTPEIIITYKRVQSGIPSYIFFIMCAMAISGGILALSFLSFNVKFRQQKNVKMSSPNLNNVIIAGSMLIYSWVGVSGIDNTLVSDWAFSLACQIRMWLLSIGFVLAFGAMFSKTWRVYRVATFKKPKRRIITDQQLLLHVTILFVIDVIILTLWQVISPWYLATDQGFERDDPNVANQKLLPYVDYCTCSWITYWFIALLGFKGLLLIFGMFLAWEIRKVQISALNDSKLIGISVYNVVILCTIGGAISLIIDDPSTLYIFVASIVLFCTTLTLLTIFIPKIISVYKYPEGQPISTMKSITAPSVSSSRDTKELSDSNSNVENVKLRKRIIQLEDALRKALGEGSTGDINLTMTSD
ncbi:gamma-aminobutyric acid type B receptor subunit 1-like [Amphiura filiformis]|uniref:gamma-aminobutyric acid type B receptor subunit 1-like n=1 Tax=Amphiura filiformis TaxID=82378 RepID=UPI003B227F8B